ncbi:MAG: hypothetical protein KA482_06310 [Sphingobium sp.]|nr:hypothetical protein [Sphingobium sp.]MBP8671038.1 hypothetical protein [Sphingobium sp.]
MSGDDNNKDNLGDDKSVAPAETGTSLESNAFFDIAMPANASEAVIENARYGANIRGRYDGGVAEWNIGGNGGGGSITAGLAKQMEKEKEATDDFESGLEAASEIHRAMTQTEWEHTRFDFAGMDMDGAEIDSLMSYMKDASVRQRLIEKRAREKGISTEQAGKEYDAAMRWGELKKKIDMGTATAAERAEFEIADANPAHGEIHRSAAQQRNQNLQASAGSEVSQHTANEADSAQSRDVRLNRDFPSAPNATESFVQANLATEPLDVPRQSVQVASMTHPPQPSRAVEASGLGV